MAQLWRTHLQHFLAGDRRMSGRKINLEAARKRIAWLEAKIQNRHEDIAQLQEQLDFERAQLATMEKPNG
jgi:hypothetical protein